VARVSDVLDRVRGHDITSTLRWHVAHPSHAYLFVGPPGSGTNEAVVSFAAALQCARGGCGDCDACRRVLEGTDPDVVTLNRRGVNWSVDELREAERIGRRKPLSDRYVIVIIDNIELASSGNPVMSVLLKALEETPSRTIYLLSCEQYSEDLATVASRCVTVPFRGLDEPAVVSALIDAGVEEARARIVATAANGHLRRALVLAHDDDLLARLALWQSVPERLDGTNATAAHVASEILASVERALAPLVALQESEMSELVARAKEMGLRSLPRRDEIEARHKREQRRFRTDDLRFGLSVLTRVYGERLRQAVQLHDLAQRGSSSTSKSCLRAIEEIAKASRSLSQNVNETLQLTDLLMLLSNC